MPAAGGFYDGESGAVEPFRTSTSGAPAILPVRRSRRPAIRGRARRFRGRAGEAYSYAKATRYDGSRGAARAARGPRARGRPAHHLDAPQRRGRDLAAAVHPPAPAGAALRRCGEPWRAARASTSRPSSAPSRSRRRRLRRDQRRPGQPRPLGPDPGRQDRQLPGHHAHHRGTAHPATRRAGAGTGRRASSGSRSRTSTTPSSCSTSSARTTRAWSARCK